MKRHRTYTVAHAQDARPQTFNTFILRLVTRGLWQCAVAGTYAVGCGSRPELAIRDWKQQHKRQQTMAHARQRIVASMLRRVGAV